MHETSLLTNYVLAVGDPDALHLEPWPLPSSEGLSIESLDGGPVDYAGRILHLSEDRRFAVGVERLGPSRLIGVHGGETVYFLRGVIDARPPGEKPYVLRAGDFCYFEPGRPDVWEIRETYVKLFVLRSPEPLPF
jgi:uncharacterized cupin superfamily protein